MKRVTRRNFVKGAAAGTAAIAGASGLAAYALPATATPAATIEVLNPVADIVVERVPPARRLTDLNNKKILLGMQKGNADVAVGRVEELFKQRYTGQQFLRFNFPGNTPLTQARIDEIVKWKPDAIFVTNGDWGSCTGGLARNSVTMEKLGFPTVAGVGKEFITDFEVTVRAVGFPEQPYIAEASNYTQTAPDDIRKDIDRLIDQIIAGLTKPVNAGTGPIVGKIRTQSGYETPWGQVQLGPVEERVIKITGKDYDEAYQNLQKSFLDWGWSDGFPVIPPTRERVEAMLKGTSHKRDEVITKAWVPGSGVVTVEKVAINAVMAGALPEYLPVILAGQEAMVNNRHLIATQSTSCHAPLFWLNGPIIKQLHFNGVEGVLGPGAQSRVNIAVGRTFRLLEMNLGGAYVGVQDMDVIGSPNKFSMVMAEHEDDLAKLGWEPYHEERGFDRNTSTISLQYIGDQTEVIGMSSQSGKGIMMAAANDMGTVSAGLGITGITFYLTGDDARMIIRDGWATKQSIKEYLAENVCVDREAYKAYHGRTEEDLIKSGYPAGKLCTSKGKAIDFTILRVGADAGKSCYSRQTTYAGKEKTAQPYMVSIDKWK